MVLMEMKEDVGIWSRTKIKPSKRHHFISVGHLSSIAQRSSAGVMNCSAMCGTTPGTVTLLNRQQQTKSLNINRS